MSASGSEPLPDGWVIKESRSQKGKEYYCNSSRRISLWSLPEVFAFERGLRQLENTSHSKFKPVTNQVEAKEKGVVNKDGKQAATLDKSSNSSCSQEQKPFRMVLKASRKRSPRKPKLQDETASFRPNSGNRNNNLPKLSPSSQALLQSLREKGIFGNKKDSKPSAVGETKSAKGMPSAKRSFSDVEKEDATDKSSKHTQSGNSQKKAAIEVRTSQFGSSASKLWGKLFPQKDKKPPTKTATEKTPEKSDKPMTKESDIKDRLAAIRARIDAYSGQAFSQSSAPAAPVSKAPSSAGSTEAPPASVKRETVNGAGSAAAASPPSSATAPATDKKQDQKKNGTGSVISSGPQLYGRTRASSAAQKVKTPLLPTPTQAPTARLKPFTIPKKKTPLLPRPLQAPNAALKHFTIPKRQPAAAPATQPPTSRPSVGDSAPPQAPAEPHWREGSASAVHVPTDASMSASAQAVQPPLPPPAPSPPPPPPLTCPPLPSPVPPPSQPPPQPVPPPQAQPTPPPTLVPQELLLPAPPPPPEKDEALDEPELMELDEPDLNDDEVLSQIACVREASGFPAAAAEVPWSHEVTMSAINCGTVDPPAGWGQGQPEPAAAEPAPQSYLTVVLDTNVLIHGVGFVIDLRDSFIEGMRPQLLIPWVVVQELDRLKQAGPSRDPTVATKARAAITFLLECFQARHPAVRGQTTAEASAARDGNRLEGRVADDAILECCLSVSRRGGHLLLLSDDKNLLTKVLLHGLTGVSRQQLLQATDLCSGITENITVTEENQICFTKILLRKVLSYVIRREMSLSYGTTWLALPGLRRPWWSLRDLVSVVCSHRTVFRTVFGDRWSHWQQVLKLAIRPVLSAEERLSLCGGVLGLLPMLQPTDHYLPRTGPLAAALRTGAAPPAGALDALGPSLGGLTAGRPDPATAAPAEDSPSKPSQEPSVSLAAVIRQQEAEQRAEQSARPASRGTPDTSSTADDADRTAAGTPPPPDDDDEDMGVAGGPLDTPPSAVLDLFQGVWGYVNTCCGVLLDAAGVPHSYKYERPAAPPSPDECASFLPELGTAVQALTGALKRLMSVSVVALSSDHTPLEAACDALRSLVGLAGQEVGLAPQSLLRFIKSPANRLLLGKGLEQLTGFLRTLEELHRMVS